MRPINVCHLSALSTVLAFLTVITSATSRTPLLTKKVYDLEVKQEQLPLLSDPRQLANRIDIDDFSCQRNLDKEYVSSEFMFSGLDKILSLETCLGECSLSERVPTLKFIPQIGNTDCEIAT